MCLFLMELINLSNDVQEKHLSIVNKTKKVRLIETDYYKRVKINFL